jgi:hypothetical protein
VCSRYAEYLRHALNRNIEIAADMAADEAAFAAAEAGYKQCSNEQERREVTAKLDETLRSITRARNARAEAA